MNRPSFAKLALDHLRDEALERDIDITESDTKKEILDKLFGTLEEIRDPIKEILIDYLPIEDFAKFTSTKKEYQEMMRDEKMWKKMLRRNYGKEVERDAKEEYKKLMRIQVGNVERKVKEWMKERFSDWKRLREVDKFKLEETNEKYRNENSLVTKYFGRLEFNWLSFGEDMGKFFDRYTPFNYKNEFLRWMKNLEAKIQKYLGPDFKVSVQELLTLSTMTIIIEIDLPIYAQYSK